MTTAELENVDEEAILENLRREAAIGLKDLEEGRYVELEPHEIGDFVRKLGEQAHQQLLAEKG